ncbi:MAG: hypothetical protein JXN65_05625 [Clostridia bacterium]|nr:hypothetical protein [Clostridia bacterium]
MKRYLIFIVVVFAVFSGCADSGEYSQGDELDSNNNVYFDNSQYDAEAINQTLQDWVLGTNYKINDAELDLVNSAVNISITESDYEALESYELEDIKTGIEDILSFYNIEKDFKIVFSSGEAIETDSEPAVEMNTENPIGETVNLIFIHHSVGENWLNAGLNDMLNENNIHVADTYYGWGEMGDRTDTSDWPDWFSDDVMPDVYNELGNMTGHNSIAPAEGENTIIMFKSCFPNSDVGSSIQDEKRIYVSLLDYFSEHPDKMFILVTPPPMQSISHPEKTRELSNWLVDQDGWRRDYEGSNLYVFDLYNVLTAESNHHMLLEGVEQHIINDGSNTLYYDSWGDDHPNDDGSRKAAEEFVPLLIYWYGIFSGEG